MCLSFERSGSKIKRETSDPAPRGATDRDGGKIDIHGKLKVKIKFGDTTYQHAVYVADIADPFILGLDFLKEGVNVSPRLQQERITVFQKGEVLATQSSNVCLQKVPGESLLLSNSPQQLTPRPSKMLNCCPPNRKAPQKDRSKSLKTFSETVAILAMPTVTQHRIDDSRPSAD
ncbi:hypothetical protein TNCV_998471 [Trichonephila clavipes]|nr:hypothetical protein TNCV_998471 [Trichonephila clavipes]